MSRTVDPRRTRKALRAIAKLTAPAPAADGEASAVAPYSGWEQAFLAEVGARLETYGSAFADLSKGAPEEALSRLQTAKLKEIAAKARGKPRTGLRARKPMGRRRRDAEPADD